LFTAGQVHVGSQLLRVRSRKNNARKAHHSMLLLFETPAGYSLFKVKEEGKLEDAEVRDLSTRISSRPLSFRPKA
tara:strand:+ start:212 stop:436 length:225 start_codon:yes stop_codon:yes gene_type:complete